MKRRSKVLIVLILGTIFVLGLAAIPTLKLKDRVRGRLQKAGLVAPELPIYHRQPAAPPDRVTARRLVVATLHDALARDDYEQAAMLNATLSQEALQRAYRVLRAWETKRDPDTGLVPFALTRWYNEWDLGAVGANLYSHLLIGSIYLDPGSQASWERAIHNEREICGAMPCSIKLPEGTVLEEDLDIQIGEAIEYTRDGLLAITERRGPGPWFDRLVEATDVILDAAYVQTQAGLIPSNASEDNGSLLQLLPRLYWATGDKRYLQMAERIAEAYLFEVHPNNRGLPTDFWDFEHRRPLSYIHPDDEPFRATKGSRSDFHLFRLVDHGGEIIPGLTELYFLERALDRPQADQYRQPLRELLDKILTIGRTDEGLWYRTVNAETWQPFNVNLNDTWGYNLVGFQTFDLAEGIDRYASEIERTMRAVATKHSFNWEDHGLDGFADSIESMLYLLPWFDIPEAHYWVDDEIEVMFLKQKPDGFVEGWWLDGNFIRTALMYAQYKTQGLNLAPWSEHVRVGAALDRSSDTLYVHLAAQQDWHGKLHFDTPRHRTIWNMPMEYPRVNAAPEWYVVEPESVYLVTNLDAGTVSLYPGQELAAGLPITLERDGDNVLRLTIEEQ